MWLCDCFALRPPKTGLMERKGLLARKSLLVKKQPNNIPLSFSFNISFCFSFKAILRRPQKALGRGLQAGGFFYNRTNARLRPYRCETTTVQMRDMTVQMRDYDRTNARLEKRATNSIYTAYQQTYPQLDPRCVVRGGVCCGVTMFAFAPITGFSSFYAIFFLC